MAANLPAHITGISQIWLINLDRRRDRFERFMQRHPEMSGRINRLPAYDGKNLELTPALARLFQPNNFEWHKPTIGCAMSHLALWYSLASEANDNASYLILEDDALMDPSWVAMVEKAFLAGSVPADWEVLFLGGILPKYRDTFEKSVRPVNRMVGRVDPDYVFGSNPRGYFHFCAYAYLLNKRGAMRLLDLVEGGNGVWMQADFFACYTTPELSPSRPVYFFHPLLAQSFQDSEEGYAKPYADESDETVQVDSDIWKEGDKFSADEIGSCLRPDDPLDIPGALGIPAIARPARAENNSEVTTVDKASPVKKVGLICVTWNSAEKLKVTLESIAKYTDPATYDLHVVDNASTDDTAAVCSGTWPANFKFVRSEKNLGWVGAINSRLPEMRGYAYVGFLNDDIEVGPGWLQFLVGILDRHKDVGAVGPLTSNDRDWQGYDRFRTGPSRPGLPELTGIKRDDVVAMSQAMASFNPGVTVNDCVLAFFCVLIRSEVIAKIGGLDDAFNELYLGDDDDYCRRIVAAGYLLALSFNSYVAHHSGSRSLSVTNYEQRYRRAQEIVVMKQSEKLAGSVEQNISAFVKKSEYSAAPVTMPAPLTGETRGEARPLQPDEIAEILATGQSADKAVAFCADRDFFSYTSVAILSLVESSDCADVPIFVFAEEFADLDVERFVRLRLACRGGLHLVELKDADLKGLYSVRHMSRATYARLLVPEILRRFARILYLDSDIFVLSNVLEVFKTDLGEKSLAAVRDLVGEKTCKIDFFRSGQTPYFNAGVLLIDTEKWRRAKISEKVLALARDDGKREKLSAYADQCLLNYVVRGDFVELDRVYNWLTFEPRGCSAGLLELAPTPTPENLREAKILHFVGGGKPWMPSNTLGEIWLVYEAVARRSPWYKSIMAARFPANTDAPAPKADTAPKASKRQNELPFRRWDYVSPNLVRVFPDEAFPQMIIGNVAGCGWPFLRKEIPHNWYIDRRTGYIGFATRDEAAILFNTALEFGGKKCLEIGCWMGWSAAHILMAGTELDIIDPVFANAVNAESVRSSLAWAAKRSPRGAKAITHAGYSPAKLAEIASAQARKWDFAFIDGDHEGDGPLRDAQECEKHLQDSSIVLFHDLSSPFVTKGLDFFRDRGWNTRIYNTMQIMGVAWRGNVSPVDHQPDPRVRWDIPAHLAGYEVSDCSFDADTAEFERLYRVVRPFTMVGRERLLSLYQNALRICRENIPGDFVECGACRGGSSVLLAYVAKTHSRIPRKVYACDTFEGMPEPGDSDLHKGMTAAQCGFPAGSLRAPLETGLMEIARRAGVLDTIVPVKGLFRDTLPALAGKTGPVSLLHADGDWYESTMDIFSNLFEKVSAGGYVQIDDYGHWEGCRKAVEDYQKAKGVRFPLEQIDYTGFGFRRS